jgi:hypothetical protein
VITTPYRVVFGSPCLLTPIEEGGAQWPGSFLRAFTDVSKDSRRYRTILRGRETRGRNQPGMTKGKYQRKRDNAALKAQQKAQEKKCVQADTPRSSADKQEEISTGQTQHDISKKAGRWSRLVEGWKGPVGAFVAIVGLIASIFSFFPHVTVSDPIQMDATDLFSYEITVANDGVLPIFRVKWALAPREIKMAASSTEIVNKPVTLIVPHRAEWTMTSDLMKSVTQPSMERHAAIMIGPGSELIDQGSPDYKFRLRPEDNHIGTVTPGDQFTFTTEGLISAPPGATYDTADFAIAISYIPIFPPIPMQTCSHFRIYKDRQRTAHWFRATNRCDRFPWLHDWFEKSPVKPKPAN